MIQVEYGYLEEPYLVYSYLAGFAVAATNSEAQLQVDGSDALQSEVYQIITTESHIRSEIQRIITGATSSTRTQAQLQITTTKSTRSEVNRKITTVSRLKSEVNRRITAKTKSTRMQVSRSSLVHEHCSGYLTDAYLVYPYLADRFCVHLRSQVNRIQSFALRAEVFISIYNTNNLRFMYDFPSRGTTGLNWSVIVGGTAAGDFSVNNVNTDIVEQVWRSTANVITIQCDSEVTQGLFVDTLAILNHNFTTSATVNFQGSNDVAFSSVPFDELVTVELENSYWIAETIPLASYRYWRIQVQDPTNSNDLQIGTIIFGNSQIFTDECFVNEVRRRKRHFADRVRTEAFSNVSNDRALKRSISLRFERLRFDRESYSKLMEAFDFARTSLKVLWIPDPRTPSRFAVFGKLEDMPEERHLVMGVDSDYIDLDMTVDEAL